MKSMLKRKNKKGFTLMEMLIVVGIIAILVAIAIPTFGGAQKKAKYAADIANVRAWYAEQLVNDMTEGDGFTEKSFSEENSDTDELKLQMKGATAEATGTTAETFKVVYDPNGDGTEDEGDFPSVTFPSDAD